jgi:nucleoside-diphosphate-sugar epimerase
MTLLITGPTGPIGQYILEQALVADEPVRVLALPETLHRVPYRNQITVVPGGLEDSEALAEALQSVDTVYHAATIAPPPVRSPEDLRRTNVDGTRRVLEACAGDIKRFVLISTVTVFTPHPTPDTWPVRAEAPRLAHGNAQLSAWGQSMIDAEDLVFEASARYGMEYTILRPTVVCGRTAKFAESVVTGLMRNPQQAEQLNAAWGTMQWVHGVDVARAALSAGRHPAARNETFIVAGDEIVTTFSLLAELWEITHMEGGDNPFGYLAVERCPPLRKFDIDKIRNAVGFTAEASVRQCLEELLGRHEFYSSDSLAMPKSPGLLQIE